MSLVHLFVQPCGHSGRQQILSQLYLIRNIIFRLHVIFINSAMYKLKSREANMVSSVVNRETDSRRQQEKKNIVNSNKTQGESVTDKKTLKTRVWSKTRIQ